MARDIEKVIDTYFKKGWYPAVTKHHPKEIKKELKRLSFRPGIKECFRNSQYFIMFAHPDLELEYREGWVQRHIPFEHAWLVYQGEVLDLTLPPEDVVYLEGYRVPRVAVQKHLVRAKMYSAIQPRRLSEISPWKKLYEGTNTIGTSSE